MSSVYTIGHSNHAIHTFLELLEAHGITALADVRSRPYSRRNPQFNRERLSESLKTQGIAYVSLGEELGGHSDMSYAAIAKTERFSSGLARLLRGTETHRVCIMCAEKDPLDCHRTLLVARALARQGTTVQHILADQTLEPHECTMTRLLARARLSEGDLFGGRDSRIEEAIQIFEAKYRGVASKPVGDAGLKPGKSSSPK